MKPRRSPESRRDGPLDPRLSDALRKFARNEIALFSTPFGVADDEDLEAMAAEIAPALSDPDAPETFERLALNLAIHKFDLPAISYDDAYFGDPSPRFSVDGGALSVGDEPISDVDTAEAAALEAAETADAAEIGRRAPRPRILLTRAMRDIEADLDEIDHFGRDALRLLTTDGADLPGASDEACRLALLVEAMREAPRAAQARFEPRIDLVFAFCGDWAPNPRAEVLAKVRVADLKAAFPGGEVRLHIWGASELVAAYERVSLSAVGVLRAARLLPLPDAVRGAEARGWIGYAPASAIVGVMTGGDGQPDGRLFYDNVRHYLGDNARTNPGAAGLSQTLAAGEGAETVLRHNGVTIVARAAETAEDVPPGVLATDGADVLLREYQIVNGAQTAFTLFANRSRLSDAHIPVKIVVTENERVKDGVVLGANTQSAVNRYDMLARRPELRQLQLAFDALAAWSPEKLWLQRRRNEPFRGRVNPQRVLTPRQLMEGFAAALLGQPHRVHDAAPQLLEDVPGKIFNARHEPAAYLAVGWLLVAARRWADRRELKWSDRLGDGRSDAYPARHQFLYALFRLVDPDPEDVDLLRGGDAERRFRSFAQFFASRDAVALTDLAGVIVREAAGGASLSYDMVRRSSFTDAVRSLTDEARAKLHGA